MPDLNLTAITRARARVADGQDRLRAIGFDAADAQGRRDLALARGDESAAAGAAAELTRLARERDKVIRAEQAARERLIGLSDKLLDQRTPEQAVASLVGDVPVLMLPARLETRFSSGGQQLDVRVFPDQVHVTAHDPALTEDELAGLNWYWEHRWPDPDDQVRADEAWSGLVARFRPGRAAFLVRAHPPTNLRSGASPTVRRPADAGQPVECGRDRGPPPGPLVRPGLPPRGRGPAHRGVQGVGPGRPRHPGRRPRQLAGRPGDRRRDARRPVVAVAARPRCGAGRRDAHPRRAG